MKLTSLLRPVRGRPKCLSKKFNIILKSVRKKMKFWRSLVLKLETHLFQICIRKSNLAALCIGVTGKRTIRELKCLSRWEV